MAADNLLSEALTLLRTQLGGAGFACRVQDTDRSNACTAVDLDGPRFVGTICFWPPDRFEFQFNASDSGEVAILETKRFSNKERLAAFVEELLHRMDTGTHLLSKGVGSAQQKVALGRCQAWSQGWAAHALPYRFWETAHASGLPGRPFDPSSGSVVLSKCPPSLPHRDRPLTLVSFPWDGSLSLFHGNVSIFLQGTPLATDC